MFYNLLAKLFIYFLQYGFAFGIIHLLTCSFGEICKKCMHAHCKKLSILTGNLLQILAVKYCVKTCASCILSFCFLFVINSFKIDKDKLLHLKDIYYITKEATGQHWGLGSQHITIFFFGLIVLRRTFFPVWRPSIKGCRFFCIDRQFSRLKRWRGHAIDLCTKQHWIPSSSSFHHRNIQHVFTCQKMLKLVYDNLHWQKYSANALVLAYCRPTLGYTVCV